MRSLGSGEVGGLLLARWWSGRHVNGRSTDRGERTVLLRVDASQIALQLLPVFQHTAASIPVVWSLG